MLKSFDFDKELIPVAQCIIAGKKNDALSNLLGSIIKVFTESSTAAAIATEIINRVVDESSEGILQKEYKTIENEDQERRLVDFLSQLMNEEFDKHHDSIKTELQGIRRTIAVQTDEQTIHMDKRFDEIENIFFTPKEYSLPPPSQTQASIIDRNDRFLKLIRKILHAAYSNIDESDLRNAALNIISNDSKLLSDFRIEHFDAEDLLDNDIFVRYQCLIKETWISIPEIDPTLINRYEKLARDTLENAFQISLLQPQFRDIAAYFDNSPEYQRNITKYRLAVYNRHLQKEFSDKRLPQEDKMTLSDIYVSPSCTICFDELLCNNNSNSTNTHDIHKLLSALFDKGDHSEFLKDYGIRSKFPSRPHNILLFGYPGQGKSSLCKRLAHDVAVGEFRDVKTAYVLPMRHVRAQEFQANPQNYIEAEIAKRRRLKKNVSMNSELSHSLLIFDGLDELNITGISEGDYISILESIFAIHGDFFILVTSRYVSKAERMLRSQIRSLILRLEPFNVIQQKQWLEKFKKYHSENKLSVKLLDEINSSADLERQRTKYVEIMEGLKARIDRLEEEYRALNLNIKKQVEKFRQDLEKKEKFDQLAVEANKKYDDYNSIKQLEPHIHLLETKYSLDLKKVTDDIIQKKNQSKDIRDNLENIKFEIKKKVGNKEAELWKNANLEKSYNIYQEKAKLNEIESKIEKAKETNRDSNSLRTIQELVSQPLLLYLVGRLNVDLQDKDGTVINRAMVYNNLVSKLAEDLFGQIMNPSIWDGPRPKMEMSPGLYREFIGDLAFAIFTKGGEVLSFEDANHVVTSFTDKLNTLKKANPAVLDALLPSFYFMSESGTVEFVHKTFREYMCAETIWRRLSDFPPNKLFESFFHVLSVGIMTVEIIDFLEGIVEMKGQQQVWDMSESIKGFFLEHILHENFFHNYSVMSIVSCFCNSLEIMRVLGHREDLLSNDEVKRKIFLDILRLCLNVKSDIRIHLYDQPITILDINIQYNNTNIIWTDPKNHHIGEPVFNKSMIDFYK